MKTKPVFYQKGVMHIPFVKTTLRSLMHSRDVKQHHVFLTKAKTVLMSFKNKLNTHDKIKEGSSKY